MQSIKEQVDLYLASAAEGSAHMLDAYAKVFAEQCYASLFSHFNKREGDDKFTIRMSSIGKPLCQQQLEKKTGKPIGSDVTLKMKFLIGDMLEHAAVAIMRGAGLNVQEVQTEVSTHIGGIDIVGHLDAVVQDKVWDIKTVSPYAFSNKYAAADGFEQLVEDDPFGYLAQGFLYEEGRGLPFGGWIAINKVSGEWAVLEVPSSASHIKDRVLRQVENNIKALTSDAPFKRLYNPEEETFYGKKTGNMVLPRTCSYCPFKEDCYSKQGLSYEANPRSKAKRPTKNWYVGTVR